MSVGKVAMKKEKRKAENKRWVKNYPTTISGVKLKVNFCAHHATGTTRLNGYLVDAETGIRHDADVTVSATARTKEEIDDMVNVLIARAAMRYADKRSAVIPGGKGRLTEIFDGLSESERALLCPPKAQAASSRKQALSYFRSICAKIDEAELDIRQENAEKIADLIRQMTQTSKKAQGNAATQNTIQRHMREVEWQLDRLVGIRPDAPIGQLMLPRSRAENVAPENEQRKFIGEDATILSIAVLRRLVENGLSLGGIFMLLGMARTAEACAPKFREIVLGDSYAVIAILWQADGTARVADLKTDNSYRRIILPKIAAEAIRARMAYLRRQGYTDAQIQDMPAVSAEWDPTTQARPAALSAFLLRILVKAMNPDADYWDAIKIQMGEEPDMEADGKPTTDISAYIARRSRCTELCNGCGMAPLLVDAMMGHSAPRGDKANWADYLRRRDNWPAIAKMTERVVHDPECTGNPAFAETHLEPGAAGKSSQSSIGFSFRADKPCTVELTVQTVETGDSIAVETNGTILVKRCDSVSFEDSTPAPFLAAVRPREYYERLLRLAESWNAASFYLTDPPLTP